MLKKIGFLMVLWTGIARAQIVIDAPVGDEFRTQIEANLNVIRSSPEISLRKLLASAESAPHSITLRPVTSDPKTWFEGSPTRSHARAADGYKKQRREGQAVPALIFLYPHGADSSHADFRNGTLVHELVHAVDIAYGRGDKEAETREKRAVVFQNIWRQSRGRKIRRSYHGRFPTSEYQNFKNTGKLDLLVDHILTKPGLPTP